jgi:hypothetical protein
VIPRALLLGVLALAGCGARPAAPPPPEDRLMRQSAEAGRLALEAGRGEEAERLYRNALARARQSDAPEAIAATATGVAAALLAQRKPGEARAEVEAVVAELRRREVAATPSLLLAGALARHGAGDAAGAEALAAEVASRGAEDAEAARRATFLRGLIAAEGGDAAGLDAARAALAGAEGAGFRADLAELKGRAALLRGAPAEAEAFAMAAAALRNESLDYRGVSRALALAAQAAERQGARDRAADLYFRAGRGAGQRGETAEAGRWLGRAEALARAAGDRALAEAARRTSRSPPE